MDEEWSAAPIVGGRDRRGKMREVTDPADRRRVVGRACDIQPALVEEALKRATAAAPGWDAMGGEARAAVLERAGEIFETRMESLMALAVREGGKTLPDAVAEVREAVDYCRYYAQLARKDFAEPMPLPGPTGEANAIALHGRGVFACISPWNFPLAIFTRPGHRRARRRQRGAGQAVGADAADGRRRDPHPARGGDTGRRAAPRDRRGLRRRRRADQGRPHSGRRLHRLDRDRPRHRKGAWRRATGPSRR